MVSSVRLKGKREAPVFVDLYLHEIFLKNGKSTRL